MFEDLDHLADLPQLDADTGTPDVDPSEPYDPHVDRICQCTDRLNRRHGL